MDGSKIISGSRDNEIVIWDAISGIKMSTLWGHSGDVLSITLSPDGKKLVSGSWDNTLKIWNWYYPERIGK